MIDRRSLLAAALSAGPATEARASDRLGRVEAYAREQGTTGFLVVQDRRVLLDRRWPAPGNPGAFSAFLHGKSADGALLEDVASQQKSVVGVLCAIAVDRGLLDVMRPVTAYLGAGWSRASKDQEAAIRVIHLLHMSSGLGDDFRYVSPAGANFSYNTPVYAASKRVLEAASGLSLEGLTREWLTGPAGMADTAWRLRPGSLSDVGNPTGLVTCTRDLVRFGQVVLDRGLAADGRRIVSEAGLAAMLSPSPANPGYGRLWWLNASDRALRLGAGAVPGRLIPTAPTDLVAALGAMDRKLYVVPSRRLVVVRLGPAAPDPRFDQNLWSLLGPATDPGTA